MGVGGRPVPQQLRVRHGAAGLGHVGRLEDKERGALAHHEPVPTDVEWPGRTARVVVVPGRQRPDDVERTECKRTQGHFAAAGDRRIDPPLAQIPQRLTEGDRTGCARVRRREDRPTNIECDPKVRRRRPTEDGEREVGRDPAKPALEVALVLRLRVRDAAQRRAEVDPDPLWVRRTAQPGRQPRVLEGEAPGDQAELAEPIELARRLRRHPRDGVEVIHLRRHLRSEGRRIEAVDALDGRACGP